MNLEKQKIFLIRFAYYGILLALAFLILKYVFPLLTPFLIAFVIAYILVRPVRFLNKYLHLPWKMTAILLVLLFYGSVGLLLTQLGIGIVSGVVTLASYMPHLFEIHIIPFFTDILYNVEDLFQHLNPSVLAALDEAGRQLIQSASKMVSSLSVTAMSFATGAAYALPGLFIQLVLMIISTFFITADYKRLTGFCLRQFSDTYKNIVLEIKEYVVGTLFVCIRSYLIIMSITFIELSIGLTFIGVKHAMLIAFCVAIFDILPVLGTGGVMIPWAVLTLMRGNFTLALSLLLLYVVITILRNIIEPKIVGSQLGLHPVVTLSSMFAGAQLCGVVGLFGFPIILSLLRHLNERGVIRLFR